MTTVFIAALGIMFASLTGALFMWKGLGSWVQKNSRYLVTFSAGIFVVVTYGLFSESLEYGKDLTVVVIVATAGAILLECVSQLLPNRHHHHGLDHRHVHSRTDARRLLIGDSFHNVIDGIVLVPAFLLDIRIGIAAAIAVFLHEAVQEISEFFVLKEAGYSTVRALSLNFLVSSTILVGVFLGGYVKDSQEFVPYLLAFAAGSFFYVIVRDLLPSTVRDIMRRPSAPKHLIAGVLGIVIMLSVGILVPEVESEAESDASVTVEA
tara:strand:- start:6491 stop:7285 length:795 start_codon:yes stop_codon:yes gene_type:complete